MFAGNRLSNLIRMKRLSILKTGPSINDVTSEGKRGEIYGDLHKVTGVTIPNLVMAILNGKSFVSE